MPEIKPFKAVFYNQEKTGSLGKVVCPPYDIISSKQQDAYYSSSKYNFVRIYLGKDKPADDKNENKYTRAKTIYQEWLQNKVLVQDSQECVYYYKQEYRIMGQKHSRLGFIALMKIQDGKDSQVFPHENTHSKAKEDRLSLWRALSSNLSCIFVCFSDREKRVEKIFINEISAQTPFIDVVDDDGVRHILWRLNDPKFIAQISAAIQNQNLFIADGHHRYEVAKELRNMYLQKAGKSADKEPFNYVMTYFTNMDSPDLKILPMHRIVKLFPARYDALEEVFRMDKLKSKDQLTILLAKAGKNENAFGLYTKDGTRLLRLKNKLLIDKFITEGSPDSRCLDATILKHFVFDRMGIKSEDIIYTKDMNEVVSMVDEGKAQAGFILNPVKIQQLKKIALNAERMPPKTTYFYPKVLSGLTVYKIE